jgi:hypothetical protein
MRYYDMYPPYVPVAQRRAKAEQKLKQLRKKNPNIKPVIIEGRTLATTWWGKSWDKNLERYADYNYRLERGRSYRPPPISGRFTDTFRKHYRLGTGQQRPALQDHHQG